MRAEFDLMMLMYLRVLQRSSSRDGKRTQKSLKLWKKRVTL